MNIDDMIYGNVENDEELLAELYALTGEDNTPKASPKITRATRRAPAVQTKRQLGSEVDFSQIEKLAKQISAEATVGDSDDENIENDDDLMNELSDLVGEDKPISAQVQRVETPPKEVQSSLPPATQPPPPVPARRPPEVAPKPAVQPIASTSSAATQPSPAKTTGPTTLPLKEALEQRLAVYQESVAKAKASGDDRKARQNQRIVKQFEDALKAVARGRPVDLSELPKPPGCADVSASAGASAHPAPVTRQPSEHVPISKSTPDVARLKQKALEAKKAGRIDEAKELLLRARKLESDCGTVEPAAQNPRPQAAVKPVQRRRSSSPTRKSSNGSSVTKSPQAPVEVLRERQKFFKNVLARAQELQDERRVRQCRRIVTMYDEALSAFRKGVAYDFQSLPEPPGQTKLNNADFIQQPTRSPSQPNITQQQGPTPPKQSKSRQQEQLEFLLKRQQQFKEAAIMAKQRGDLEGAKQMLKQMKGFEPMIEASRNGLPVNITETPIPPQARTSARALQPQLLANIERGCARSSDRTLHNSTYSDTSSSVAQKRDEVLSTLEGDLIRQVQLCEQNQEYFTRAGDVAQVARFEQMATDSKRDLLTLRNAVARRDALPGFHYESRELPVLRCNADLGDDELELGIIRVLSAPLPEGYETEHADIYVTWEMGYPDKDGQKGTTKRVQGTTSPAFNERCRLRVSFSARAFQRYVKRHGIKFEVWQKTGLLRSDKLLGTAEVKLMPIETEATIHESLDLMSGRKTVGGKIEVKIRVRRAMVKNEAKTITQKWLVLDPPAVDTRQIRLPRAVYKNRHTDV